MKSGSGPSIYRAGEYFKRGEQRAEDGRQETDTGNREARPGHKEVGTWSGVGSGVNTVRTNHIEDISKAELTGFIDFFLIMNGFILALFLLLMCSALYIFSYIEVIQELTRKSFRWLNLGQFV